MRLSNHQKAILALVIANIIWGAASPIFKWSLTNINPFTLAFLRFSLAALLVFPFAVKKLKVEKKDWINLVFLSLAGVTFNITFFFLGLKLAPAINAPIIATAGPILLLVGCLLFLKEKIRLKIALGTALGFLGVALIILRPIIEDGFGLAALGNFFFVLATLGAVVYTILTKKLIRYYEPITLTFWAFFIGAVTFLPLFLFEIRGSGFLKGFGAPGITGVVFGIFLCSALAYYLYNWAIKNLWAQEVGVFVYLDPIVAIVIAYPLLGEIPTPTYLLGALLVFLGIFITEGRIPYHPIGKRKEE